MDQDSFRRLIESGSGAGGQPKKSYGSLLVPAGSAAASKRHTVNASGPGFKPRKVKKSDEKYRNRAAERRAGEANDFAQVEAVLEDFERRRGDDSATDEQRKYLGGDSEHTILVKGLDMALLEQNKAKASLSIVDDESLEQAYQTVTSEAPVPQKRTREDIIRELKGKRGAADPTESKSNGDLETAKKNDKFKPIGFKPIGAADEKPKKKKKAIADKTDGERKKKRRRVEENGETNSAKEVETPIIPPPPTPADLTQLTTSAPPEDDPPDGDFDIFAGVGEYEGVDLEDEDGDEEADVTAKGDNAESEDNNRTVDIVPAIAPRKWFKNDEPDHPPSSSKLPLPTHNQSPPRQSLYGDEEGEAEEPTRLVPLSSSAIPSIKDFLAMEGDGDPSKKKGKKGKRKKKSGKGGDDDDDD
ncbi:hypothetical protein GGX14DRAFT_648791 [Mycena pura]|uniref:RED-like N-terminal domain-containing protein n=1 Tax=Mycena pura TaxID=153505 RepID=A0AAD7E2I0_9AGAR|nr:hypothetical protein GGX14DRAFT_648791 [Mycena pura]